MVNKGHGMAHVDWVDKMKKVWKRSINLLPRCCVNSEHCLSFSLTFLRYYFLLWSKVSL